MSAREEILGRVRDALAIAPGDPVSVPREYLSGRQTDSDDRLGLLVDRLEDYRAVVRACEATATSGTVGDLLTESGVRRIAVPPSLDSTWLDAFGGEVVYDDASVPPVALEGFDAVVTGCAVVSAETGTIFLDAGPGQGRRALTLVPDLHVCVVPLSSVVTGVPEAVARLTPDRPITLISGPSATSDIELERVEGVHGPRTLRVVVQTDA